MEKLIDRYQAALFDLDGVVYLGPQAVPGAAEGIAGLHAIGKQVAFVTNNAARRPSVVVDQLTSLGVPAVVEDVVTSAQAIARLMANELPADSKVLVVGTEALAEEVRAVGLTTVESSADQPVAIVQGYDPAMTWPRLDDACFALQAGARWFASNTDSTRPTDKGLVPGAGSQINVVQSTVTATPTIAGKPCTPLLVETMRRIGTEDCIFVGDRIDTDVMGAVAVGMDSLFVFTGAHGVRDLLAADETGRPTHLGWDLRALLEPTHEVTGDASGASCGAQRVDVVDGLVQLASDATTREEQLDALRAGLWLVWGGHARADEGFITALDQLR